MSDQNNTSIYDKFTWEFDFNQASLDSTSNDSLCGVWIETQDEALYQKVRAIDCNAHFQSICQLPLGRRAVDDTPEESPEDVMASFMDMEQEYTYSLGK